MSALPVIEPFVEPAPVRARQRPQIHEPIIIELPRTRNHRTPAKKVKAQKRTSVWIMNTASFFAVSAITFGALSLGGQVMVEKARRDGIRANKQARDASRDIATLRGSVQDLTSSQSIQQWAATNGFVPIEASPKASGVRQLVAFNR